ncbi:MAG: phosphatase PAP2 family protein [Desulfobacterales bacterium]|nr:MAG: phosphatase PAP2 family protein [Desulfobacterales bacterium]
MMILIPLSRIYLGVHFPTDLVGGYLVGALLLTLYIPLLPRAETWLAQKGLRWQIGAALGGPTLMLACNPGHNRYGLAIAAVLMGCACGLVLERRWVHFSSGGPWWQRGLRFLLGMTVLGGLSAGLRLGLDGLEPEWLAGFVRYVCLGLWVAWGAPWVFVRLKLAAAH